MNGGQGINEPPAKRPRVDDLGDESKDAGERRRVAMTSSEHVRRAIAHARSKVVLVVNTNQLANPMLRHVRHVSRESRSGLLADFMCGPTTCVLYLSLQYHKLHPSYIYKRVSDLGRQFRLRVLLVLVDVADHREALHELTRLALLQQLTVLCAGSEREAARYLETLRSYDSKGAESIQERVDDDYASKLNAALSSIRGVNRTDVSTLAFTFGSVRSLALAAPEDIRKCPGIGERKVQRLYSALHQPFRKDEPWCEVGNVDEDDVGGDDERPIE